MKIEQTKFVLWVRDMDRAFAFYRDVIGLQPALRTPYWSELSQGDAIVALHAGGSGASTLTGLSFQVADLEAASEEVASGGGRVRQPPMDRPGEPIRLAEVLDTEGNVFQLTQVVG